MATSPVSNITNQTSDNAVGFVNSIINMIPALFLAIIVFLVALLLAKIVKSWAQRSILKSGSNEGAMNIVGKTAYIGTIIVGLTVALKILEIDISFIVAAMGFGLGFAMKDILENYFSGVLILIQRPFTVGDIIKAGNFVGKVEEIEARATFLRVFDGQRVIIPNSTMISTAVINYSSFPERRLNVEFYISYDADIKKASEIVLELMKTNPKIMQTPSPAVMIKGYGDANINLCARFWVDRSKVNWVKLNSEMTRLIIEELAKHDICASYQVVTLNVNKHDSEDIYALMGKQAEESPPPTRQTPPITSQIDETEQEAESSMHLEPVSLTDDTTAPN